MMSKLRPLLTPTLFILTSSLVSAQTHHIDRKIDSIFSAYNSETPGVSIAIVKNGEVVFKKGYGSANLEYGIPITSQTIFNIASVSKQFTAFAIYLLERQGKLSFEDDIRKYFPDLPGYGKPIKIKHLLAHTSGLRDQAALLALAGWHAGDVRTTEQILRMVKNQKELNFEPGTAFGYSNTGYTLLAEIVAQVSKQSFTEFTSENIFNPLGMVNTHFSEDSHHVIKNRAYSYEKVDGTYVKRELNNSNPGPSDLMTTVEDLAKWVDNFSSPKVGDKALINDFNKVSLLENNAPVIWAASAGDTTYHAKGQTLWDYKGLHAMSHGGHTAGFRAVMTRFPENNFAIITLSNDEHYQMLGKVLPITELYLKDELRETPAITPGNSPGKKTAQVFTVDLKEFQGTYVSEELMTTYKIKVHNNKLYMTHPKLSDIELTQTGENSFSGTITFGCTIDFLRSGKKVDGFEISNFGVRQLKFQKKE
jgi:CubicO group peptidase (beta-lactamase class C family)